MGLFSYEEFMDIHTRAIGEGSTFNDAFHRALIVAVRKFLEYHNFKSNLVTEKNLADDTLLSYKNKLKFWHSHEATCRLILFDLNYMIARLGPVKGNQEQKHTGSRQGGQVHGPFRPGKYVFPDPKYARSSHDGPLPPIYTPRKSEYPNPFGKPFKPAESRKSVPPKPEDPSTSNGSFAPPGPGKSSFRRIPPKPYIAALQRARVFKHPHIISLRPYFQEIQHLDATSAPPPRLAVSMDTPK
jgi:hypothetical protein